MNFHGNLKNSPKFDLDFSKNGFSTDYIKTIQEAVSRSNLERFWAFPFAGLSQGFKRSLAKGFMELENRAYEEHRQEGGKFDQERASYIRSTNHIKTIWEGLCCLNLGHFGAFLNWG